MLHCRPQSRVLQDLTFRRSSASSRPLRASSLAAVGRRLYWASFALTPIVLLAEYVFHVSGTVLFVLAAVALTPLAFLIGEATENLAEHTGEGIGGFLNASFGNAPELIIGVFAIGDGLAERRARHDRGLGDRDGAHRLRGGDRLRRRRGRQPAVARPPDRRDGDRRVPLPDPVDPRLGGRRGPAQPLSPDAAGGGRAPDPLRRDDDAEPAPASRLVRRRSRRTPPGASGPRSTALTVATVATAFVSRGARRVDHRVRRASSASRSSSSPR